MKTEFLCYKNLCPKPFQTFLNAFPMRISGFVKAEKTAHQIRISGVSSAHGIVRLKQYGNHSQPALTNLMSKQELLCPVVKLLRSGHPKML
jgi:hypothetical protein